MDVFSSIFTIIAALVLPLAAAVWVCTRKRGYLKPLLLGAATFFVFQVIIRIPLLQYVFSPMPWFITLGILQPVLAAAFYGVTAALFEEGGRWIVMRLFMRTGSVTDGIVNGIGHGGIEAVLLVGINTLVALILGIGSTAEPGMIFAGGVERLSTMLIQIAFSVMVLKSVTEKTTLWLLAAFLLHAFIDTAALLAQQSGASVVMIETGLAVTALALALFTFKQYKKDREEIMA